MAHDSSEDIGNHRYTNEQNCILFGKKSMIKKKFARLRREKFFLPPQSQNRSYGLDFEVSMALIRPKWNSYSSEHQGRCGVFNHCSIQSSVSGYQGY